MSEKNMGRLAQDMKRELIAIISRLKDPRLAGGLLTVTRLDVTPDLDVAKVYISVMGAPDGPAPVVEALNRAAAVDESRSLEEGAVRFWEAKYGVYQTEAFYAACRHYGLSVPAGLPVMQGRVMVGGKPQVSGGEVSGVGDA